MNKTPRKWLTFVQGLGILILLWLMGVPAAACKELARSWRNQQ